jgi:hypothetical protein
MEAVSTPAASETIKVEDETTGAISVNRSCMS